MRFVRALLIFLLAAAIQFWLAGGGIFLDLLFAVLIVFAFFMDFWEMAFFILLGIFLLNWMPAPSLELVLFALIPLAFFFFRSALRLERWVVALSAIALGSVVFYLVIAPRLFIVQPGAFLEDLCGGLIAGALAFWALTHYYRTA